MRDVTAELHKLPMSTASQDCIVVYIIRLHDQAAPLDKKGLFFKLTKRQHASNEFRNGEQSTRYFRSE
jgi:hypothetical protein